MKSLEEVKKFIVLQAKRHQEEDDLYECIEIDTYREIVRLWLSMGFTINKIDLDVFLNGINYDDEDNLPEDDSFDSWYYFERLLEKIALMEENDELPPYVKNLHIFWLETFWPS